MKPHHNSLSIESVAAAALSVAAEKNERKKAAPCWLDSLILKGLKLLG